MTAVQGAGRTDVDPFLIDWDAPRPNVDGYEKVTVRYGGEPVGEVLTDQVSLRVFAIAQSGEEAPQHLGEFKSVGSASLALAKARHEGDSR